MQWLQKARTLAASAIRKTARSFHSHGPSHDIFKHLENNNVKLTSPLGRRQACEAVLKSHGITYKGGTAAVMHLSTNPHALGEMQDCVVQDPTGKNALLYSLISAASDKRNRLPEDMESMNIGIRFFTKKAKTADEETQEHSNRTAFISECTTKNANNKSHVTGGESHRGVGTGQGTVCFHNFGEKALGNCDALLDPAPLKKGTHFVAQVLESSGNRLDQQAQPGNNGVDVTTAWAVDDGEKIIVNPVLTAQIVVAEKKALDTSTDNLRKALGAHLGNRAKTANTDELAAATKDALKGVVPDRQLENTKKVVNNILKRQTELEDLAAHPLVQHAAQTVSSTPYTQGARGLDQIERVLKVAMRQDRLKQRATGPKKSPSSNHKP